MSAAAAAQRSACAVLLACLAGCGKRDEVAEHIQNLKAHANNTRVAAAEALGESGDPRAIEPLIEALNDSNSRVRLTATRALAKFDDDRIIDPLLERVADESDDVRKAAAERLVRYGERVVRPFIRLLSEEEFQVRSTAIQALGRIGRPAFEPLVAKLKEPDVRVSAASALACIGDARAVEPIIAAFHEEKDWDNRHWLAHSLGSLGDKAAVPVVRSLLPNWRKGFVVARILEEQLHWTPRTDEDRVHFWTAKEDGKSLKANWEMTKTVLLADATSGDKRKVENAVYSVIALGREEMVAELIQLLEAHGDKVMAETFLNSNHGALSDAAQAWAKRRGYKVEYGKPGAQEASWGEW